MPHTLFFPQEAPWVQGCHGGGSELEEEPPDLRVFLQIWAVHLLCGLLAPVGQW